MRLCVCVLHIYIKKVRKNPVLLMSLLPTTLVIFWFVALPMMTATPALPLLSVPPITSKVSSITHIGRPSTHPVGIGPANVTGFPPRILLLLLLVLAFSTFRTSRAIR